MPNKLIVFDYDKVLQCLLHWFRRGGEAPDPATQVPWESTADLAEGDPIEAVTESLEQKKQDGEIPSSLLPYISDADSDQRTTTDEILKGISRRDHKRVVYALLSVLLVVAFAVGVPLLASTLAGSLGASLYGLAYPVAIFFCVVVAAVLIEMVWHLCEFITQYNAKRYGDMASQISLVSGDTDVLQHKQPEWEQRGRCEELRKWMQINPCLVSLKDGDTARFFQDGGVTDDYTVVSPEQPSDQMAAYGDALTVYLSQGDRSEALDACMLPALTQLALDTGEILAPAFFQHRDVIFQAFQRLGVVLPQNSEHSRSLLDTQKQWLEAVGPCNMYGDSDLHPNDVFKTYIKPFCDAVSSYMQNPNKFFDAQALCIPNATARRQLQFACDRLFPGVREHRDLWRLCCGFSEGQPLRAMLYVSLLFSVSGSQPSMKEMLDALGKVNPAHGFIGVTETPVDLARGQVQVVPYAHDQDDTQLESWQDQRSAYHQDLSVKRRRFGMAATLVAVVMVVTCVLLCHFFLTVPVAGSIGAALAPYVPLITAGLALLAAFVFGPVLYRVLLEPVAKKRASAPYKKAAWWNVFEKGLVQEANGMAFAQLYARFVKATQHEQSQQNNHVTAGYLLAMLCVIVGLCVVLHVTAAPVLAGSVGVVAAKQLYLLKLGMAMLAVLLCGQCIHRFLVKPFLYRRVCHYRHGLKTGPLQKWHQFFDDAVKQSCHGRGVLENEPDKLTRHCKDVLKQTESSVFTLHMQPPAFVSHALLYALREVYKPHVVSYSSDGVIEREPADGASVFDNDLVEKLQNVFHSKCDFLFDDVGVSVKQQVIAVMLDLCQAKKPLTGLSDAARQDFIAHVQLALLQPRAMCQHIPSHADDVDAVAPDELTQELNATEGRPYADVVTTLAQPVFNQEQIRQLFELCGHYVVEHNTSAVVSADSEIVRFHGGGRNAQWSEISWVSCDVLSLIFRLMLLRVRAHDRGLSGGVVTIYGMVITIGEQLTPRAALLPLRPSLPTLQQVMVAMLEFCCSNPQMNQGGPSDANFVRSTLFGLEEQSTPPASPRRPSFTLWHSPEHNRPRAGSDVGRGPDVVDVGAGSDHSGEANDHTRPKIDLVTFDALHSDYSGSESDDGCAEPPGFHLG